jgi:hypothetical protein
MAVRVTRLPAVGVKVIVIVSCLACLRRSSFSDVRLNRRRSLTGVPADAGPAVVATAPRPSSADAVMRPLTDPRARITMPSRAAALTLTARGSDALR